MSRTANMVWRLAAGLLMLAALVAIADVDNVKTLTGAAFAQPSQAITEAADERQSAVQEVRSANHGTERPCDRYGSTPGQSWCPMVPCITVCSGLPAAPFAIPAPPAGTDSHASVADDPSRGISTIPDLPPPRPFA